MRILFLNHNVIWKSAFHRCFYFAKMLVDNGHETTIITNHPRNKFHFNREKIEGVDVVQSPDLLFGSLRSGWDLFNVLRRILWMFFSSGEKFDLIHAFDTRPTVILPALLYSKIKNVPLIIDWGDWWGRGGAISLRKNKLNYFFSPIEVFFEEFFKKYADQITVVSPLLEQRAKKLTKNKIPITLIPNAAYIRDSIKCDPEEQRRLLQLPLDRPILIFSGFVLYDIELVINTVRYFKEKQFPVLLILTGMKPQDIKVDVGDLIEAGYLKFTGLLSLSELHQYFFAANLGLMPMKDNLTNRARCPMKFGEYLSCGLPVLTNHGFFAIDKIKKYKLGAVSGYSAKEFAGEIESLLSQPALLKSMSKNAFKFVEQSYNFNIMFNKLLVVYEQVI